MGFTRPKFQGRARPANGAVGPCVSLPKRKLSPTLSAAARALDRSLSISAWSKAAIRLTSVESNNKAERVTPSSSRGTKARDRAWSSCVKAMRLLLPARQSIHPRSGLHRKIGGLAKTKTPPAFKRACVRPDAVPDDGRCHAALSPAALGEDFRQRLDVDGAARTATKARNGPWTACTFGLKRRR